MPRFDTNVLWFLFACSFAVLGLAQEPAGSSDPSPGGATVPDAGEAAATTSALGPDVVATIDGETVPYEWFLHEFRSSFFRYGQADDARREAFRAFLDRMILFEVARQAGVAEEEDLRDAIRRRVEGMRAFMDYQIAMTERQMVIERFLEEKSLSPEAFGVSDEELKAYFEQQFAGKPGTTTTFEDLPPFVAGQLRERVQAEKQQKAVDDLVAEFRREMSIAVNEQLVENVPLPKIVGEPPFASGPGSPKPPPPPPPPMAE